MMTRIYHFKILVPAAVAGRIIGKGGTTIAQLQKDAGARIKMSKASEFYPGTTERVCLISGPVDGILKIHDFFMENFSSTAIKILVPNSTAGMIIGKAGSYIKQIKDESGAYVQISQKSTDLSTTERCVTVVGELDSIRKACAMILEKIVEDVGGVAGNNNNNNNSVVATIGTGNCLRIEQSPQSLSQSQSHNINNNNNNNNHHHHNHQQHQPQPQTQLQSFSGVNSVQMIEGIKAVLRMSGYGEDAVSEISTAMSTLANYGVLGIGLGLL